MSAQPKLSREVATLVENYSADELKRVLAAGEKTKAAQDEGRKLGQINNSARATTHRDDRLKKAEQLSQVRPYLARDLDLITVAVFTWTREQAQQTQSGRFYSLLQIRRELKDAGYPKVIF